MILTKWQTPIQWAAGSCRQAATLRNEVDHLFNHALNRFLAANAAKDGEGQLSGWSPTLDLYDNHDSTVIKAELPGMKKEDINISLKDGVLTVSGERKEAKEFETSETYRSERLLGRFERAIRLPSQVEADKIKATYKDGVLTVVLPKAEAAKPKNIPVNIN